jgi:predicted transcriptional regulator of viral defense system
MNQGSATLFTLADEHDGVFTVQEAADAGISRQNLVMLARRGTLSKLSRGIYRLLNYPANEEQAQLWEAVLWPSVQRSLVESGTLSHLTALHLHHPALNFEPATVDLTVAPDFRVRREQPKWLRLHFTQLPKEDIVNVRGLPITALERSLLDCIEIGVERRLLKSVVDASEKEGLLPTASIEKIRSVFVS